MDLKLSLRFSGEGVIAGLSYANSRVVSSLAYFLDTLVLVVSGVEDPLEFDLLSELWEAEDGGETVALIVGKVEITALDAGLTTVTASTSVLTLLLLFLAHFFPKSFSSAERILLNLTTVCIRKIIIAKIVISVSAREILTSDPSR